jgi:hypothetical protein
MRGLNLKAFVLVAGIGAASLTASAQSSTVTANIPFAFTVNSGNALPAGEYRLQRDTIHLVWRFINDAGESKMGMAASRLDEKPASQGKLVFACRAKSCELSRIEPAVGEGAYFAPQNTRYDEQEGILLVVIPLKVDRAD